MLEWINENWLALYGSIVGTIALFLNASRLIHTINKEKVKLSVSLQKHPDYEKNLLKITNATESEPFNRPNIVKLYDIAIRNIGSVSAHIENAGILTKSGEIRLALISYPNDSMMLGEIPSVGHAKIEPKASTKISVYLRLGEECFTPARAFVTDSTGKEWNVKA